MTNPLSSAITTSSARSCSPWLLDAHQTINEYDAPMRTTVTLDPDTAALVRKAMRERGMSFKEAVNTAIRAGLGAREPTSDFRVPTFDMGRSSVPLDKALALAGEMEDEEILRRLALGK